MKTITPEEYFESIKTLMDRQVEGAFRLDRRLVFETWTRTQFQKFRDLFSAYGRQWPKISIWHIDYPHQGDFVKWRWEKP